MSRTDVEEVSAGSMKHFLLDDAPDPCLPNSL